MHTKHTIPEGFCQCGCGNPVPRVKRSNRKKGIVKGQFARALPGHRVTPKGERFWDRVDTSGGPDACWEWMGYRDRDGYGSFWVYETNVRAHRFAYESEHGPVPDDLFVCHSCDNPSCVNPRHLWAGTPQDNVLDMDSKGRRPLNRGESNHIAKLTESEVIAMRRLKEQGHISQAEIARRFGVSPMLVSLIVRRMIWTHI